MSLGRDGAFLELLAPYRHALGLWTAQLVVGGPVPTWLAEHGRPIRYGYVPQAWPLSCYQNVYATEPGSAEMPSAGRPFTVEMITQLVAGGTGLAPIVLHTGVASLEPDELPYPERARVTSSTARHVNATRAAGGRVLAVGTTVVRALESAFDPSTGQVEAMDGWTELVVTPDRWRKRRRRPAHGLARARSIAPADARSDRRPTPAGGRLLGQLAAGLPMARVWRCSPYPAVKRLPVPRARPTPAPIRYGAGAGTGRLAQQSFVS